MHQTFYIDIDEEITSIVERMRKSRTNEVVMVVPKRALLIQSIVNLRLLKKEADGLGLTLMIVTQDKLGKLLIEKAGILVQQKIDDVLGDDMEIDNEDNIISIDDHEDEIVGRDELVDPGAKTRLENIGSESFFDRNSSMEEHPKETALKKFHFPEAAQGSENSEVLTNKELVTGIAGDIKKSRTTGIVDLISRPKPSVSGLAQEEIRPKNIPSVHPDEARREPLRGGPFLSGANKGSQNKKIEDFYYKNSKQEKNNENDIPVSVDRQDHDINLSGKSKKWAIFFFFFSLLVAAAVLCYLFLPGATIAIGIKNKTKTIDSEVRGDSKITSLDLENETVPLRVISADVEATKTFPTSGKKSVSSQKAHGTITIYNEYSASPQPLVATTRFESEGGKIFRIQKAVVVPGMSGQGDGAKPGSVQAEVVADQSGDEYNIGPGKFTIPGFKESGVEKYAKFYAKSESQMTGGGSSAQESGTIAASDVSGAKTKILPELEVVYKKKIQEIAGGGTVVLDDAISKEEATYKLSNSEGAVAASLEITARMKITALVFSEADIKKVAGKMLQRAQGATGEIKDENLKIEYGKADPDFSTSSMDIKIHAVGSIIPEIDLEKIQKELPGKNESEITDYLKTFPDIERFDITYQPDFLGGRIPIFARLVNVHLSQ
jgi:hypothetical protein